MKRRITHLFFSASLLATVTLAPGCVSQKKYTALQAQYADLAKSREQLEAEKKALEEASNEQVNKLNQSLTGANQQNSQLTERLAEVQRKLEEKDRAVQALRKRVADALLGFNAQDLQVNLKNGKVYVSLSEQLLFKSGSTKVDPRGQDALRKLAEALKGNQDVNVLVEGHTDNVPIARGTAGMRDNWDLSVLRATEITRILTESGMAPEQVTPSGRSRYLPVAANDTPQNKAMNRRTEIILTPKLDELFQILEQN